MKDRPADDRAAPEGSLPGWDEFQARGFVILERVLSDRVVADLRAALAPWLEAGPAGRNDFEGYSTNRVYALLAKSPRFAELAIHPLALAYAEAELGRSCLLSACLAINLHPGETVQPWHHDDSPVRAARPRPAHGLSAFWALDDTTVENGATEVIPGSHLWGDETPEGAARASDFTEPGSNPAVDDPGRRDDAVALVMPAGSLALLKGTLWHRGGANRSAGSRLIVTPQYCAGWVRPLETMTLAVPPAVAARLPARAAELLGYSIHPPFVGYVDGMHPQRLLDPTERL